MTISVIKHLADLGPHIAEIARGILGEPNERLSTRTQLRFGTNGSVAVEIAGQKRGQWYDHEAETGGGPWDLLIVKGGMTDGAAIEWLRSVLGIEISRDPVAVYDYHDERGTLLFQVCRFEPKTFRQRKPDGKGGWIWSVRGLRRVPYRLPKLITAPADCTVFVGEGEKDCDWLASLGLIATCNPGGAGKWRSEFNKFFKKRDVVIVADNDNAGREHAQSVAANLAPVAASVRILELPGLLPKGDVSDWLDTGGTREELEQLAHEAPLYQPSAQRADDASTREVDYEAEIARLAALPSIPCDRELPAAAKQLGCRVSILRAEVKAARDKNGADTRDTAGQGRRIEIPDFEPWCTTVDGPALLEGLVRAIREYVVLSTCQADAVALWIVFTHAFEAFDFSPKLIISSPEKRSGKTRLVEVCDRVTRRPFFTSGISAAALLRVIERHAPTMLLDEIDAMMKGDAEMAEVLRGMINSGFTRAAARFVKNVPTSDGGFEPRAFSTWCPKLLAGIGKLPDTVVDRAIIIEMTRKRPEEKVRRLRSRDGRELQDLGRQAVRWVVDNFDILESADPEVPEQLNDRAADAWLPVLAIADAAGGEWPARARRAAIELSGSDAAETTREMLLHDIRDAFDKKSADRLASEDLVDYLIGHEERPWAEISRGKPLTKSGLAALLTPLKVKPVSIRLDDGRNRKGYYRCSFDDVFARYATSIQFRNVTTSQARNSAGFRENRNVTGSDGVTGEKRGNPSVSAHCDGVTDREPMVLDEATAGLKALGLAAPTGAER
jgi:hypothetical protein